VRTYGERRRVPGLRREELAQLAGVSVAYYTRLEQGVSRNASDGVLGAIASALRWPG
jgi:transcriptional regulator with XRE-family HTH domain